MEVEQSKNFNERLSQWVANQGFWFQIRYSMVGSGSKGALMFQLLSISFRIMIFLLIVAAGTGIYLVKRLDGPKFKEKFRNSLQTGLGATESQMGKLTQLQGQLSISQFACKGGNDTFFSSLEARNIRCKMGILDGLSGVWDTGTVAISRLDIDLRAGADDPESAHQMAEAIFKKFPTTLIRTIEVADASIHWGYSDKTYGAIRGCNLKIIRNDDQMKILIHGGTFSQNWLRKLAIVGIEAQCNREGVIFNKAEFKHENGTVDFSGLKLIGGERPTANGLVKVRRLSIEDMLPSAFQSFIEGTFSGDFKVSGSTNNSDGIGFSGMVTLDGQDTIILRERIPVLKALSVVDYSRNYRRVDFREGSFQLKTTAGGLEITNVDLKAEELFTMTGTMRVRLPTIEEAKIAINQGSGGGAPMFVPDEGNSDNGESESGEDFTLKRAALEAKRLKDGKQDPGSVTLFERMGLTSEMRRLEEQESDRSSRTLRYEGQFIVTIPHDAFERTPRLAAQYPIDPATNRIPILVPIEGTLYDITLKQAEDIYQQGRQ